MLKKATIGREMDGFGPHQGNHLPADYMGMGKRPFIMPPMDQMNRPYENPNAYPQRFGASSSTRYRDMPGELPLPSTIQNLEPALRDKAILVGKLVSRAASRIRRPGGQRPIGAFGEHFCQCGKDYMNICGLNNHWKLSHKMPGKPPQLYVPASVQSKLLQGLDLTNFDLHSVQIQVSHHSLEMFSMPPQNNEPVPWQPEGVMYPPQAWGDAHPPRPQFMGEMPGMMMRGPMHPGAPLHMGMGDPRDRMMPHAMHLGGDSMEMPGMVGPMRTIPPPYNYEDEYFDWSESAKEFQHCVEAWLGEAGTEACTKLDGDSENVAERRQKEDIGLSLSKVINDEQIWSTVAIAIIENDRLLYFMGEDRSHWAKLFFQTRNKQISATQAIGLFLITLRPKLSAKFFIELAATMSALVAHLACNSEKKPPLDIAMELPKIMERFATDFFPQFILDQAITKAASAFQILGLAPSSHQRLYSTLRLLSLFLDLLGVSESSVTWNLPLPNAN